MHFSLLYKYYHLIMNWTNHEICPVITFTFTQDFNTTLCMLILQCLYSCHGQGLHGSELYKLAECARLRFLFQENPEMYGHYGICA